MSGFEEVVPLVEDYHYMKKPRDGDDFDTYEILVSDVHQSELVEQGIAAVNDVILVAPENQMGVHSYKVIINKDGEKIAEPIQDYNNDDLNSRKRERDDDDYGPGYKRRGGKKNKSKKQRKSKKGGKTRKSKKERKTRKNRK
jgi:hypothetical protein